jgi:hypothetical protein
VVVRERERRERRERRGRRWYLRTARQSPTFATKRYRFVTSFSKLTFLTNATTAHAPFRRRRRRVNTKQSQKSGILILLRREYKELTWHIDVPFHRFICFSKRGSEYLSHSLWSNIAIFQILHLFQ